MKFLALLGLLGVAFGQTNFCDDAYECKDDTINSTFVYCYGYFGCDAADITTTYGYYYGFYAAYYSDMSSYYTYAYGYRALFAADVLARDVYAYGYQAAINANIEPQTSDLYAYMYGYNAGFNADILCYSGDCCYVYCGLSSGCDNSNFYCYSGATCYYHCDDADSCPTLYGGVSSDISFEGDTKGTHYEGLTDDEIKAIHVGKKARKKAIKKEKEDELKFEGETDEAKQGKQEKIYSKNGIFTASEAFDISMVYDGAAVGAVCFVFGLLFGDRVIGSDK